VQENTIICGDCLEVMKDFPDNCVDTIITDPPYGLGFMGKEWDHGVPGVPFWEKFLCACKPGAIAMVFGGTRTFHRLTCAIEDAGWQIRDCMMWLYGSGFPKSHDISKAIDKAKGAEREVVKTPMTKHSTAGKGISNELDERPWMTEAREKGYHEHSGPNPATDLAKQWHGYGTALKPAWEPIIVAMKPLDGTFAQNAEKWDVGGLWIDGGRIGTNDNLNGGAYSPSKDGMSQNEVFGKYYKRPGEFQQPQGRWPANVILDEEAAVMLGQPSRFFYCAKASRSERNAGLEGMEKQITDDGREKKIDNAYLRGKTLRQNNHPTVKPLKLMEYLCKLTRTPEGGVVLDPFGGSGTTAVACRNTGRKYILIEKDPHYCEIANNRVKEARAGQGVLFE